jgi:Na+:H+ antiporter, NhaA family
VATDDGGRRSAIRRALSPVERFLSVEAASGLVLLLAALLALVLANSPLRSLYHAVWNAPLRLGRLSLGHDLHFWINDGLMTVFFFVIGLEIRRELRSGGLVELRRAALPVVAALGGMLAPALLYLAFNHSGTGVRGWAVPVATDIAFAAGVLGLLGRRTPPALRVLLLALAVVDDVGAIAVIALFYSTGITWGGLVVVAAGLGLLFGLQKLGARAPAYLVPGLAIWVGAEMAGIHPALAGVVVGLLAPLAPLEHRLHGWVAFAIMPLFALANAGVPIGGASLGGQGLPVFAGITVGLVIGKPAGIVGLTWLAARMGLTALPAGVRWRDTLVLGQVAGVGFTMALFISALAFPSGPLLETAKLAVLTGSALSALGGLASGRALARAGPQVRPA